VDSGEPVVLRTGGLDLSPADAVIPLDDYRHSLTAAGVAYEELDAAEIMRRWPQWRLPDNVTALYQERTGLAMASRANATHRFLARENGATLIDDAPVTSIREVGRRGRGGRRRRSPTGRFLGDRRRGLDEPCAGHFGVHFPLDVSLEHVVYTTPVDPLAYHPNRFPVWIWMDEPCFYGFPIFGEPAVKTAWDRCGLMVDPDARSFEPDADTVATIRRFAADHLPGSDIGVHLAKNCLYTLTPDRDFVIDRVPGTERVYLRHRRRPRLQVRLGDRAAAVRSGHRRDHRLRSHPVLGETGPSWERPTRCVPTWCDPEAWAETALHGRCEPWVRPWVHTAQQAAAQSASAASTAGSSSRQRWAMPRRSASPLCRRGQRGWKRQPEGTLRGSGISPVRIC
jgi:hypothetical protein